jgi:hypothetical protein
MDEKMKYKKTTLTIALFAVLLALPFAAADSYELYCLGPGESIDLGALCNPAMDSRTGPTNICMHHLDNGKSCPTLINACNNLGLGCSETANNTHIDQNPPVLTINSPIEGEVYTERGILLDLDVSELANIDYQDKSDPQRWKQVCTRCSSYSRERGFEEGLNDLTFRVKDIAGNVEYFDVAFRVDSNDPRIRSVDPTDGFTSGLFVIEIDEENPETLELFYGNTQTGFNSRAIDIGSECVQDRTTTCTTQIDLAAYDGEQIEYYVELTDVAGSTDTTGVEYLSVDYSAPIINSLEVEKDGRRVTFILDINEPYFEEAVYFENIGNSPREKNLCSRLDNNICEKSGNFQDGNHEVEIIVRDEAGNEATQTVSFLVDSDGPRITEVMPDRDFASGLFTIEFEETAPTSLVLEYGNFNTGMRTHTLDIGNDCTHSNDVYFCSAQVSLADYNGEEVEYEFTVEDIAQNIEKDGADGLKVDISHPEILSLDYDVDGRYVSFLIEIDESDLEEVTYIDNMDPDARERRLCSRLDNGICDKRVSFRDDGDHDVSIMVYDEAGHVTAQSVQFFTDSSDPRIRDVTPERRDFASGLFTIEFDEQNPTSLVLDYGNDQTGMRAHNLDLNNDCNPGDRDETYCMIDLNLADYDGEEIEYMFTITDRVGQTDEDGESGLPVDITFPIIESLDYQVDDRGRADIIIEVTEQNLDEITYINNDDRRPRERRLCSRLDSENKCEKTISLNDGSNDLVFMVLDEAGNSVAQSLTIEYNED